MQQYRLPQHVFVCALDETCVWLDTRADRFRGTSKRENSYLGAIVEGWPEDIACCWREGGTIREARDFAESLVRIGLLTRSAKRSKPVTVPRIETPKQSLPVDTGDRRQVFWQDRRKFAMSSLATLATLKCGSLQLALETVAKRKVSGAASSQEVRWQEVRDLVYAFMWMRTGVYSAKRKCLFDSINLASFLASYGIFAELVIGVSESPFHAHSWLQRGDTVLNYEFEYVKQFQPVAVF